MNRFQWKRIIKRPDRQQPHFVNQLTLRNKASSDRSTEKSKTSGNTPGIHLPVLPAYGVDVRRHKTFHTRRDRLFLPNE